MGKLASPRCHWEPLLRSTPDRAGAGEPLLCSTLDRATLTSSRRGQGSGEARKTRTDPSSVCRRAALSATSPRPPHSEPPRPEEEERHGVRRRGGGTAEEKRRGEGADEEAEELEHKVEPTLIRSRRCCRMDHPTGRRSAPALAFSGLEFAGGVRKRGDRWEGKMKR